MPRSFFCLAILILSFAAGCRMCGSPYDYCVPGYIDRAEDYRGCDPKYRAGSIFYTAYNGCENTELITDDLAANRGNFGVTTSINAGYKQPQRIDDREKSMIGLPNESLDPLQDGFEGIGDGESPDIDNLLDRVPVNRLDAPATPSNSPNVPLTPPLRTPTPKVPSSDSIETMPFTAPSSEPTSVDPPITGTPEITIEELRKLDPTVTDIKILNVEDSHAAASHLTPRR